MERLDKLLSNGTGCSRKEARDMIRGGRISVNGQICREPEKKVDPERDLLLCDDSPVANGNRTIVLMLHKPAGCVTAIRDDKEKTVMDYLPAQYRKLTPVGRLDKETEGLLLFTNDGDLAHRLISPKHGVVKTYYAEHEGAADAEDVEAFRVGCELKDGTKCLPALLEPLGAGKSIVRVREGKYHQVRRMLASRGMPVTYLRRISEGELQLGELPLGKVRELTSDEITSLFSVNFDEKFLR